MNPTARSFPEPLESAVRHAERCAAALEIAEAEQRRRVDAAPRELDLAETWILGRAEEARSFVKDVLHDWSWAALSTCSAALAIDLYVRGVHRGLRARTSMTPACCAHACQCLTVEFSTPLDLLVQSCPDSAMPFF